MIIVTNSIKTKKGFAAKMAPSFTKPSALQEMEGFVKVEVAIIEKPEDHDVMNVNMYWEEMDNFTAWRNSDLFKEAHKGGKPGNGGESPILGSELIISEVASVLEAKPAE